MVDMLEEDGSIRRIAAANAEPDLAELAEEIRNHPPSVDAEHGVARALRTGQSELLSEMPEAMLTTIAQNEEHFEILRRLAPQSHMVVPFKDRGKILGAITFVRTVRSSNRYTDADLRVAEDLARRATVAVENARLYGEAQQAIRARDEFLSVAAHELKTPVTGLLGFSELARSELDLEMAPASANLYRAIEVIEHQAAKLSHLVSQLLDVSRIEAGKVELNRTRVSLTRLAVEVAEATQRSAPRHTIVVRSSGPATALVDAIRMEQVLANLTGNAVKFTPDGGTVELELTTTESQAIRIAITDQGVGVPVEHRGQIFDRFYQAHARGFYGGMGLGLYISRQIVELHGGRLEAEFPTEGGTRFVAELPSALAGGVQRESAAEDAA